MLAACGGGDDDPAVAPAPGTLAQEASTRGFSALVAAAGNNTARNLASVQLAPGKVPPGRPYGQQRLQGPPPPPGTGGAGKGR